MQHRNVLTLVADGRANALEPRAARTLSDLGATLGEPVCLAESTAVDLPFDPPAGDGDHAAVERRVRRALGGEPVDLAVQGAAGRRKRLLVADMESTMIRNEMLDELADFAGRRAEVGEITNRAMNGELDFVEAVRQRVAVLEGLSVALLETVLERVVETPGARTLVTTMRAHGASTALVSGGFHFFAERVRQRLGFDVQDSNQLEFADGRLTGRVIEPVRDRAAKLATLERLCGEHGVAMSDVVAVGDGANDLAMIEAAGMGVAFHARPSVARAAGFRVDHGDLETLLFFQGYERSEFRSS